MDNEEDIIEEEFIEKDRSAESKRKRTWQKAVSRFNLIKHICNRMTEHPIGYYRNNNEANANTYGTRKTKTRKSSASYRHKGGYGKAIKYSRHDKKQIDSMADEISDN